MLKGVSRRVREFVLSRSGGDADRAQARRLTTLRAGFQRLGTNTHQNISHLTALCGELLGATCVLYNRLHGDLLCSVGQWRTPPDFHPIGRPDGSPCYDVIRQGGDRLMVVRHLQQTSYARTDPNVMRYGLQTYVGMAVKCGGTAVGALSALFQQDVTPGEAEEQLMGLLAAAIGLEEERSLAQESLLHHLAASEASEGGIAMLDQSEVFVYANAAFASLHGYTGPAELIGLGWRTLYDERELRRFDETILPALAAQGRWRGEATGTSRDGSRFPQELSLTKLPQGGTIRIVRDISERKQTEELLRKTEEQLRQAQKVDAIGRLSGGVAHDFNNLLMAIRGYCDLLLARIDRTDPLREHAEEIKRGCERGTALTRQLLVFGRKQAPQPMDMNLNQVVADTARLLRPLIGEQIELVTELDPALGSVRADRGQLEQIIVNLALNARDAMPQGGMLTIHTSNVELAPSAASDALGRSDGRHVLLVVRDTGIGMDEETRQHCFEPFFTTKGRDQGTGLGLSTIDRIVKQSDGRIEVSSEVGRGAEFRIYLPQAEAPTSTAETTEEDTQRPSGSETILLAEDERVIRGLLRSMLQMRGYRVLEAARGEEALQICQELTDPIHLLLTDVVMPGMNGRELADRVVSLRPKTRVLYISGYPPDTILRYGLFGQGSAFLQKPFSPEALFRKVREVLAGDRS